MPLGSLVHPPARPATEEAVRGERRCRGTRGSRIWSGSSSRIRRSATAVRRSGSRSQQAGPRVSRTRTRCCGRSTATITGHPEQHLDGFDKLKDDGSTTCASWIYCGVYPAPDQNLAARKEADPPGVNNAERNWGWAWPANRRVLYNRASADLEGRPWSERKSWVWWDGKEWTGYDMPDFRQDQGARARRAT